MTTGGVHVGQSFSWIDAPLPSPNAGRLTVLLLAAPDAESTHDAIVALREIVERKRDDGLAAALIVAGATAQQAGELQRKYSLAISVAADPGAVWSKKISGGPLPCLVGIRPNGKIGYVSRGWDVTRVGAWRTIIDKLLAADSASPAPAPGKKGAPASKDHIANLVGHAAPEVPVTSWVNEPPTNYTDHFVLYSFWATTCPYSREMLSLIETERAGFADNLASVAISGENPATVATFVTAQKLAQPIGIDTQNRAAMQIHVSTTPYGFLRAPDGKVVWQGNPLTLWRDDAKKLRAIVSNAPSIKPSE